MVDSGVGVLKYCTLAVWNNLQFLIDFLYNIHVTFHKCPGQYWLSDVTAWKFKQNISVKTK